MESKIVLFLDREEPAQVPSLFREGMCFQHAGYRLGNLVSLFLPQMTPSHLSSSRHVILHLETSVTEDVWVQDSRVPAPALEQPCQRLLVKSQSHSTPQSLKKSMNQVDSQDSCPWKFCEPVKNQTLHSLQIQPSQTEQEKVLYITIIHASKFKMTECFPQRAGEKHDDRKLGKQKVSLGVPVSLI